MFSTRLRGTARALQLVASVVLVITMADIYDAGSCLLSITLAVGVFQLLRRQNRLQSQIDILTALVSGMDDVVLSSPSARDHASRSKLKIRSTQPDVLKPVDVGTGSLAGSVARSLLTKRALPQC